MESTRGVIKLTASEAHIEQLCLSVLRTGTRRMVMRPVQQRRFIRLHNRMKHGNTGRGRHAGRGFLGLLPRRVQHPCNSLIPARAWNCRRSATYWVVDTSDPQRLRHPLTLRCNPGRIGE